MKRMHKSAHKKRVLRTLNKLRTPHVSARETHFILPISPGHFCTVPFLLLIQAQTGIPGTEEQGESQPLIQNISTFLEVHIKISSDLINL